MTTKEVIADYYLLYKLVDGCYEYYDCNNPGRRTDPRKKVDPASLSSCTELLNKAQYDGIAVVVGGKVVAHRSKEVMQEADANCAEFPKRQGDAPLMVSGFGQYHTDEPDPTNPDKKLTPYVGIEFAYIRALVDDPQQVKKSAAQWVIPSSLMSREFKRQEVEVLNCVEI